MGEGVLDEEAASKGEQSQLVTVSLAASTSLSAHARDTEHYLLQSVAPIASTIRDAVLAAQMVTSALQTLKCCRGETFCMEATPKVLSAALLSLAHKAHKSNAQDERGHSY